LTPSQDPQETALLSIVTAPSRAKALPDTLAPVVRVMLAAARISPKNAVPVPIVAELPTCQNTLKVAEGLITITDEPVAVVRVLAIWNMKTALGSFWASRTRVPVNPADDEKQ
jgi:hypothetical protein